MEELKTRFDLNCSTWKRKGRGKWRCIPSFALLYAMDEEVVDPAITSMVLDWWVFRLNSSDEESITFDSYMITEDDWELDRLHLLEVDNRMVVPANSHLRRGSGSTALMTARKRGNCRFDMEYYFASALNWSSFKRTCIYL